MPRLTPLFLLVALAGPSLAQQAPRLGTVDFPTSAGPDAQEAFVRGVLFLHSFEYEDARSAFQDAQRLDGDFAMAYWGEAMTFNHPVWQRQYPAEARAALERLGPSTADRLAKAPTPRERQYLLAVETLFGEGSKEERDFKYRDVMRRLHERFPGDHEAAAFYALSLLGTAHDGRDFATYMRAAAVVEPVFAANPDHPGAVHYLIHSYDDPVHAPLGLPAAKAYSVIAPAAGHAQHMTSHIFVAMGMWDDVVRANENADRVQNARLQRLGRPAAVCGHYTSWLEYGYLQQGRYEDAARVMDACHARIASGDANGAEMRYFASMRARYVIDTEDWEAADRWTTDFTGSSLGAMEYQFTTALAAIGRGDPGAARGIAERMAVAIRSAEDPSPRATILAEELRALLTVETDSDRAVSILEEAAQLETELPYEFGPPATVKPPHELLGQVLQTLDRSNDARRAFEESLSRTPGRTTSLLGVARTAAALGDDTIAEEAYRQLAGIWRLADGGVKELAEVMRVAAGGMD